ncbi:MAG TPA: MAPEG family protein, partial [Povalibacter sp.]
RFRIHANTLEQLVMFVPLMWIFAHYVQPQWAAALGVVFVVGRTVYSRSYMRDPGSRTLGFVLTALPMFICMVGILWGAGRALLGAG